MGYFLGQGTQFPVTGTNPTSRYTPTDEGSSTGTGTSTTPQKEDHALCLQRCYATYKNDPVALEACQRKCIEDVGGDPNIGNPAPSTPDSSGCPADAKGAKAYEGCSCGDEWNTSINTCPPGYVFQTKLIGGKAVEGMVGRCVCQKAIDDYNAKAGASKAGSLGEYKYPSGMSDLMSLLLGRGKELMGMPLGYSQDAMDKMFGLGFENVRATERPAREQLLSNLSRTGMSGTGTAAGQLGDLAWNTEKGISDLARNLFISNEEKKKADLLDYTSAAKDILGGGGLNYENMLESINAARRGEGNTALMLLLQLLGQFGG
jgi:hypothetical protein